MSAPVFPTTNVVPNTPAPPTGGAILANTTLNAVQRSGDMSLWDTVLNKFVTPETTNVMTGGICTGTAGKGNYPNQ